MNWLFLAIITRFFWAGGNIVDQYVSRYFGRDRIFSIMILQNLMALLSMIILAFLGGWPAAFHPAAFAWVLLIVALNVVAIMPYLRAVQIDEVRNIVPLYEMVPLFVMVLAWLFLGETMTARQIAGALLVILSGFAFIWDFNHGHLKRTTLGLIAMSALFYACGQLIIRHVSESEPALTIAFYFAVGLFIAGVIIAIVRPGDARDVVRAGRASKGRLFMIAGADELCTRLALLALIVACARAPTVGHVAAFSGTQPVFVFMLALLMSVIKPLHYQKMLWDTDMRVKLLLLPVMVAGGVLVKF